MNDKRALPYWAVRIPLGLFLLTTAGLKAYQLATEPTPESSLLTSRWFLTGVVELELLLGLLLLSNLIPRYVRGASLVLFTVFACISAYKALSGETNCGCFGQFHVNPWWTLAIDLGCIVALAGSSPSGKAAPSPDSARRRAFSTVAVAVCALALAVPTALAIWNFKPSRLDSVGKLVGDSDVVVLDPQTWLGDEFPLAGYIDIGQELLHGNWIVVLLHHDCPKCQEAVAAYERAAEEIVTNGKSTRIALIELPPYGADEAYSRSSEALRRGRLTETKQWFASTPCEIKLQDGRTEAVSAEGAAVGQGL